MAKNEKNLIPLNKRTKDEQRAIQSKGGKACAAKKREAKTYRELIKTILPTKIADEEVLETMRKFGITGTVDIKTLTLFGMIKAAAGGSEKAFEKLLELTGENVLADTTADPYDALTVEELRALLHDK